MPCLEASTIQIQRAATIHFRPRADSRFERSPVDCQRLGYFGIAGYMQIAIIQLDIKSDKSVRRKRGRTAAGESEDAGTVIVDGRANRDIESAIVYLAAVRKDIDRNA